LTHASEREVTAVPVSLLILVGAMTIAPTVHASGSGGAVYPEPPRIDRVRCVSTAELACDSSRSLVRGGKVRIAGRRLQDTARITFRGARGRGDDVAARPTRSGSDRVEAVVPTSARSGRVTIVDDFGREVTTRQRLVVVAPPPIDSAPGTGFYFGGRRKPTLDFTASAAGPVEVQVVRQSDSSVLTSFQAQATAGENALRWNGLVAGRPAPSGTYSFRIASGATGATAGASSFALFDHLFPIRGPHNLGYTNTNQFGGGRGHQGIDMFASCGTKLAVARGGKVQYAGYHSRAGNYAIIDGQGTGADYVYMHMLKPALVRTGQRVFTGQKLGEVGESGRATGCHLHFELWSAPGWYEGGRAIDPLPSLKRWRTYK
jgi:hypothetical protein